MKGDHIKEMEMDWPHSDGETNNMKSNEFKWNPQGSNKRCGTCGKVTCYDKIWLEAGKMGKS